MPKWPEAASKSARLYERALQVLPGGISRLQTWNEPFPFYARSAFGARVTDVDGTVRLDFVNNFASLIHGHAHPVILEAVARALQDGTCFALPTEVEVELAELLCGRYASFERVRYCNTGTEAVMLALKAARAATGRPKIAKLEGAYHGMYDYAEVSLDSAPSNWGNDPRSVPFAHGTPRSVLEDVVALPYNQPEAAERILTANRETLAGVLVDVAPSYLGMIPMTPAYAAMLRRVTREIGAVLIADEVISLRLAYAGGQARFGLEPDLTTAGKIIGGGFPVACIAGTADAMAVFDHRKGKPRNPSSGTFTANPIGLTAGLTAMRLLDPGAFERLEGMGQRARDGITAAFRATGYPGQVTGVASMFQIHLCTRQITDYRSAYATPAEGAARRRLQQAMLERGVIISNLGFGFLSTAMNEADIDQMVEVLGTCLSRL